MIFLIAMFCMIQCDECILTLTLQPSCQFHKSMDSVEELINVLLFFSFILSQINIQKQLKPEYRAYCIKQLELHG